MGMFDFPDLTLKESGVTSKGLNKYRRGGNHSHSAAWILISYLAQGRTRGGRFSDAGRLQSTLKNQQIKKEGSHGGESRHWEAAARRHFGSTCSVLLMGLNETITAPPAFALSRGSADYPPQMSACSRSARSPCEGARNSAQRSAERAPELLLPTNASLSKKPKELEDARVCRRNAEGTTKKKHEGSEDGKAAVKKYQNLEAHKVRSSLQMGGVF